MSISRQNLTLVIVTFKSQHIIDQCLQSIDSNIKIIIVENSKDKDFKNYLEKKYKNVSCILSNDNIGSYSITNMFNNTPKKIVIVIDDLYSMNYGDKNGIVSLIKLVRFKKTKKQLKEAYSNNPIICINTNYTDKKILEWHYNKFLIKNTL